MLKNLFKALVPVLVALTALAGATFSTVSAEGPTATATPSATAPSVQTPTFPRAGLPAAALHPLAVLRRLGLDGGVVVANDGSTITARRGKITGELQIASTTILVVPGIKNAKTSDVQIGDRVIVKLPNRDPKSVPSLVLDFPKGYTANNVMAGVVQVNNKGTVTLRTRRGPQQITPTDSTVIVTRPATQPALGTVEDMARGDVAIVVGQNNGDQLNPQVILVLDRAALQNIRRQNQPTPTPTP